MYMRGDDVIRMEEHGKGFNAMVVDGSGKKVIEKVFDTGSPDGATAFDDFLKTVKENDMLMLAVEEDGQKDLLPTSIEFLEAMGADQIRDLEYRSGYIFAGIKGKDTGKDERPTSIKGFVK